MYASLLGVSAVLFDEYEGGVRASSRTSMHTGSWMLLLPQAALATCAVLFLAPKVATTAAGLLRSPYFRLVLLGAEPKPFRTYTKPPRLQRQCKDVVVCS